MILIIQNSPLFAIKYVIMVFVQQIFQCFIQNWMFREFVKLRIQKIQYVFLCAEKTRLFLIVRWENNWHIKSECGMNQ